jgi:hypothetical protein
MQERELRSRLQQIIDDIDTGRLAVPRTPGMMTRVGGKLCVAALGLGLCACPSKGPTGPTGPGPAPTVVPTAQPAYAVPAPEYMAPDPGTTVPYMAPDPGAM